MVVGWMEKNGDVKYEISVVWDDACTYEIQAFNS
jgi:hypothetical protein